MGVCETLLSSIEVKLETLILIDDYKVTKLNYIINEVDSITSKLDTLLSNVDSNSSKIDNIQTSIYSIPTSGTDLTTVIEPLSRLEDFIGTKL